MPVVKSVMRWSIVVAMVIGLVGGKSAVAQTSPYLERAARVQEMRANMPTQAQREAAAAELKAFKAKIDQARRQALKAGLSRPASAQTPPDVNPPGPGGVPDYFTTSNWAFSPPLKKFVNTLPGLTVDGANDLGNYIPIANPDTITYPGSDYYEISVKQYQHKFHEELGLTTLRGYVQTNKGTDGNGENKLDPAPNSYLGPIIVAKRDRPVRIKFTNELPFGDAGKLMVPVDTTIQGSGPGPLYPASMFGQPNPLGGLIDETTPCDASPTPSIPAGNATPGPACAEYTQNRAAIHLHGGRTPWISDGTPHQWIIPASDWVNTPYKEGVSLENVPDMPNPGPGSTTYYFSNQQSARLMFYHDHAWGITRLNVLVGVAAGYLITDDFEAGLVGTAQNPGPVPSAMIPLIIQDRTFVAPDVRDNDPTWNWGTGDVGVGGVRDIHVGDLWIPHVYMAAQNPFDTTGVNPYGRWVYGPWFFPPTTNIMWNTKPNPYHDPACSDPDPAVYAFCTTPGQPPVMPGTPVPSVGAETFFDTAVVNGQAFPTVTVDPKAYRFRILNAANDRFMNLNLYKADPDQVSHDLRTLTEVKMVTADGKWSTALYPTWPADGRPEGVPDPTTQGPPFIQIGTEGGFLPRPVVVKAQPITFVTDPTAFNVGNVKDFGLFLGPAERADVIVDFSDYAGQTLILYNDAPAAVPAFDPRHDFLTGAPDLSSTGGYGRPAPWDTDPAGTKLGPQIGYGPNTRTIMQITVSSANPAPAYDLAALEAAFAPNPDLGKKGVFEEGQEPVIVGQDAYNGVYTGVTFPKVWPNWGFARIQDESLPVFTVGGTYENFPMEPKGMHDEMGASFDMEYGRMSANLGITNTQRVVGMLNLTIYKFHDPSTEILNDAVTSSKSPSLGDGTQIWKISHNGVDTHPIHFHIFDVQVLNRVGWDGQIRPPHPTELGWKDTVRISPLEDTIVAMRPWAPKLPFGIPESLRMLNPALPLNATYGFTNIDPITQQPKAVADKNRVEKFGWEYVWHCHILSHEENDMMRPIVLNVATSLPGLPSNVGTSANPQGKPVLTWEDASPVTYTDTSTFGDPANEIAFRVERSDGVGQAFATLGYALANATSYTDTTAVVGTLYRYRVVAYNESGEAVSDTVEFGPPPNAAAATSLDLTVAPASPLTQTLSGIPVVFTAAAGGGSGAYEYRFWLSKDGAAYAVVQAYGPLATLTLPASTPAGTYNVKVDVRTTPSVDKDLSDEVLGYLIQLPATASVTLSADAAKPSPGFFGTAVLFTAVGADSSGYQYRFWLGSDIAFPATPVQDWSATPTWTLPATTLPGSYRVKVDVRTSAAAVDASAIVPYVVVYRPATTLSVRAKAAGPYVRFSSPAPSFLASGGGSALTPTTAYLYRFSISSNAVDFTEVQGYGTNRIWNMPSTQAAGTYTVKAEVKTNASAVTADKEATLTYVVVDSVLPAEGLTLSSNPAGAQHVGASALFTAAATGGTPTYYYRFSVASDGVTFNQVQAYSATATYTLPGNTPVGTYTVKAEVKTTLAAPVADRTATLAISIVTTSPATGLTLEANQASPQLTGSTVILTARATGGVGDYQYRFWKSTDGGTTYTLAQAYGLSNTYQVDTSVAASYRFLAEVRTNSIVTRDLTASLRYEIVNAPATGVTLAFAPNDSVVQGSIATLTATATSTVQGATFYYRFLRSPDGATWTEVQPLGTAAIHNVNTAVTGTFRYMVEVTTNPSSPRQVSASKNYTILPAPATGVALVSNVASPQQRNAFVQFTANGTSNVAGLTYEYRFWVSTNSGAYVMQGTGYGLGNTFVLPTGTAATYRVLVDCRTVGRTNNRDANTSRTYIISP